MTEPPSETRHQVKVKIDEEITYLCEEETRLLMEKAQQVEMTIDGRWKPEFNLPDINVLQTFADRIYKNFNIANAREIEITSPWKLLYRAKHGGIQLFNGFYGELYFNTDNNYLLMVIKGTSSIGNIVSDVKNVFQVKQGGEIDSVFTFGEKVRKLIIGFKCKPMLLITGHSLGGYLAQIATYTIINCFVDENVLVRSREKPSEDFGIYTVVIDSPAAYTQICKIDPRDPGQLERFQLPITNLIYKINLVNNISAVSPHMGQVLAIKELDGPVGSVKMILNTCTSHSTVHFANIKKTDLHVSHLEIHETSKYNSKAIPLHLYPTKFAERLKVYTHLPTVCKLLIGKLPKYTQTTTEIIIEDDVSPEEFIPQAIQVLAKSKEFLDKEDLQNKILNFFKRATPPEDELLYCDQAILMEGTETQFESANDFAWELAKGRLRFVVISSDAGMGKSTALKQITLILQQELPHYLIAHLNLCLFQNELSQIEEILSSKEQAFELVRNLVLGVFKDDKMLNNTFNRKQEAKEMVVLLDSLDEICPLHKDTAHSLIERLRDSDIQIVVTTRPNAGENLRGAETFTLEPLHSNEQKFEFLSKRFILLKIPEPKDLLQWISDISFEIDAEFWSAPLSLVMAIYIFSNITKIHKSERRLRRENIYKEYLNTLIEETLEVKMAINKNKSSIGTDYANKIKKYNKLVEILAISTIFHFGEVKEEHTEKIAKYGDFINRFFVAKLDYNCRNVSFVHKSYAEYLTARVFYKCLWTKSHQPTLNDAQLKNLCLNLEFREIRGHICGFLASSTIEKVTVLPEIIKGEESKLLELLIKEDCYELYMHLKDYLCCAHDNFVMQNCKGEEMNLLYLALERARESFVKELLKEGANFENILHMKDVLRYAVEKNLYEQLQAHTKGLKLSIQRGEHYESLKHVFAMKSGSREMAELLIENGLEMNIEALHIAAMFNNAEVADLVVEENPDLTTGIIFTAKFNRISLFNRIYEKTEKKLLCLQMALSTAAANGHLEFCELLIDLGATSTNFDIRGESSLHHAAAQGHLQCLKFLIKNKVSVDLRNENGETPLMKALFKKRGHVVQWLLDQKADIQAEDKKGHNCLHFAAHGGNLKCLELLVEQGFNIDRKAKNGRTALHHASVRENASIVKYLLTKSQNPNISDEYGNTCLHLASRSNIRLECVKLLMLPCLVNSKNCKQQTPLQVAIYFERKHMVAFLLQNGAGPNLKDIYGDSSLLLAVKNRFIDIVRLLLGENADVNAEDKDGRTSLHSAVGDFNKTYASEIVKMLLAAEAKIDQQAKDGQTALFYALSKANSVNDDRFKLLLKSGADLNVKDNTELTCLHMAARNGLFNAMKQLDDKGADVNVITSDGKSFLQFAVEGGVLECVEFFVDRGAKINHMDKKGWTALYYAAMGGKANIIKYLLEKSAKPDLTDHKGNTCLHYVRCRRYHGLESVELLVDLVPVDCKNHRQETPLHLAASEDREDIVSLLLERGADPCLKNIDLQTSLHLAAKGGHLHTLKVLLEKNAGKIEIDGKDKDGYTAFLYAVESGKAASVKYLFEKSAIPNVTDNKGNTCLHLASRSYLRDVNNMPISSFGHNNIVSFLLEKRVDRNVKNIYGQTSLHLAAKDGLFYTVTLLIDKHTDLEAVDKDGRTPFDLAEQLEDKSLAEYLRDKMKKGPGSSNGDMLVQTVCNIAVLSQTLKEDTIEDDLELKRLRALMPSCDFKI